MKLKTALFALILSALVTVSQPLEASYALVSHYAQGTAINGGTTTSGTLSTTGANLIVVGVSFYTNPPTLSDNTAGCANPCNTWTQMTGSPYTYFGVTSLAVYYAYAPTTGGNHQFTLTGATEYGAIAILAFSGAVSSPFDQHNGNALATNTTIQPGSITPTATNALVVSFAGSQNNNTTFSVTTLTLADQIAPSSTFNGVASAYELTNAGAINPTWTFDVAPNQDTAAIVSFLDGSGITPSVTLTLLGVGSP